MASDARHNRSVHLHELRDAAFVFVSRDALAVLAQGPRLARWDEADRKQTMKPEIEAIIRRRFETRLAFEAPATAGAISRTGLEIRRRHRGRGASCASDVDAGAEGFDRRAAAMTPDAKSARSRRVGQERRSSRGLLRVG